MTQYLMMRLLKSKCINSKFSSKTWFLLSMRKIKMMVRTKYTVRKIRRNLTGIKNTVMICTPMTK